ncbi:protein quick-to-court isoform X1 [Anastrepha ludens]|uniref:protein quick-to-court isoform X1 n=1 Tax=Anastrepha ludens TaxID=28586 RepID=UPI0023B18118|nr:protein quick-to-court isoform X1 [Anastrepha ludens]XP_053961054.1 protein quick-to-court isoform X1 [Anastrepha ludens]XP_053961056.1 protein quick-to-court isoform X1 [Anastrepha ludens]XP_053961057.1 protein quick-to-court isoform X1 [Anastrepha ludens]XP_053961058.1 protein quick-to-court isoform X1 [Anastrepha ludens]XP_053961059.1 protein quick-to-court isoform X1 [Anastrepha ludens]
MTSLSIAKTSTVETSLVATTTDTGEELDEMAETSAAEVEAKQKIEKEGKLINNNNPITDIVKETNAMTVKPTPTTETVSVSAVTKHMPATATATPQFASASKIPHLQQQQSPLYTHGRELKQLLHSPDPFRRSVSLRMRGSKSNLFNNYGSQYLEMERNTRHLSNITAPTPNTTNTHYHPLTGVLEQRQQQQHHQSLQRDTHERYPITAGSFGGAATRRKAVVLLGSAVSTQTPAATVGNLTRSQSLRRSYLNYNYYSQQKLTKTDAIKEKSAGGVTKVGSGAETGADAAITGIVVADNVAPLKQNTQREIQQPAGGENCAVPNGSVQGNDITYKEDGFGEKRRIDKDMQRMGYLLTLGVTSSIDFLTPVSQNFSLNLNGSGGERSTTTTKSTATVAAAAAVAGTPTGNGSDANRIAPVTPKTPNNVAVTTRYVKSSPTTAQETKLTPKTPPVTPDSPCTYLDDDLDSMYSFATTTSGRSTMSCEHPYVARNGTTFSGRKMKYVVHCSNYAGQVGPDYLTPTQRAARHIRRLKELLCLARQDLEQKDSEILRLTREVVELRLFKASLSSPEERSASSDAVTVREAELKTSQDVSPIVDMVDDATKSSPRHIPNQHHLHTHSQHLHHTTQLTSEMQSSFADSGHFEDLSVHSKDSYAAHTQDIACGSDEAIDPAEAGGHEACATGGDEEDYTATIKNYELQRQELIRMYEQKIEELIRTQDGASSEMKRSHNDKVEALLQKLAECNTRYADIVPDYEHAKERIRELEKQLEDLQRKLAEHEEKQNKMYLHMYQKGQEAERIARADQALELAHRAPDNKVSINELLHQLQNTQDELENIRAAGCRKESGSNHALLTAKEAISLWVLGARKTIYRRLLEAQKNRTHVDPEVTLQFLKSAIYYFLTDKENSQGHLQAIESILEFTEAEKQNINRARMAK